MRNRDEDVSAEDLFPSQEDLAEAEIEEAEQEELSAYARAKTVYGVISTGLLLAGLAALVYAFSLAYDLAEVAGFWAWVWFSVRFVLFAAFSYLVTLVASAFLRGACSTMFPLMTYDVQLAQIAMLIALATYGMPLWGWVFE